MNIRDAYKSILRSHEDDQLLPLTTPFGETLNKEHVLSEYPRPQLVRKNYTNLNGIWEYAITSSDSHPSHYQGDILVPFSPEASLSGVNRQLKPDEYLWYRRTLPTDRTLLNEGKRLILHFGAVDYIATVYVNQQAVITHEGGYTPFEVDITPYLLPQNNVLTLRIQDFTDTRSHSRGKQTLKRGGIFYTAQSGIWQTVWMEWVSPCHIKSIQVQTDYDMRKVTLLMDLAVSRGEPAWDLSLSVSYGEKELCSQAISFPYDPNGNNTCVSASASFVLSVEDVHPWSPESPSLYDVTVCFGNDTITSYFAMRSFTIEKVKTEAGFEAPVFCLNHKPLFLHGVLDQGYWPDGLYTAPSDEALIYDITCMKNLGFNMLRKHIKVESARWYYHCDRLGMIVCQDMVNGGSSYRMPVISYFPTLFPKLTHLLKDNNYHLLSRKEKEARISWEKECMDTIEVLSFFPCIAIWCPFNEGWGQFDSERITELIRQKDKSRLIDSASGWFDQGCGDFISEHNYFRPLKVSKKNMTGRAYFLSEYGGYACHINDHSSVDRVFGYKRFDSPDAFKSAFYNLINKSLFPLKKQGLSGAVYTQLSDVEEEVNGILTYDRKINKLSD